MSLLLDALQRASQEKDKSSQAVKPKSAEIALEPSTLPPEETPTTSNTPAADSVTAQPPAPVERPIQEKPALEFSFTPEEVPVVSLKSDATPSSDSRHEPAADTSAHEIAAPAPKPTSTPIPPVDTPKPAPQAVQTPSRETVAPPPQRPAPPPLSPRTAREILGASAPRKAPAKRLVILASIAGLLALSLGGAFFFLGMPGSNLAIQLPAASTTPPAAPPQASADPQAAAPVPTAPVAQAEPPRQAETPGAPTATLAAAPPVAEKPAAAAPATPRHRATPAARPLLLAKSPNSGNGPLDVAYAALLNGRLDVAADAYRRALAQNGEERDALLGLAYIAHRLGKRDQARAYYERVLRQDPENAVANSGLLAMLAEGDPASAASRARDIAEKNPDSAAAFSTLGNILAREGNFAEAQQAFFRAATLEPASAFHAYNLAVALDRLHKSDLAANYYARALALGEKSGQQAFPKETARQRLEQLRASQN